MGSKKSQIRTKAIGLLCSLGVLCQFSGCDLGSITTTTTTTVDGRDAIAQLIRGAIITPLDALITNAVYNAFDAEE